MADEKRRLDFEIFRVNCGQTAEVGLYAGDAPNIDPDGTGLALRADIPRRSVIVMTKDPDEQVRGYLWETKYKWPSRIHVWINKGREDDPVARRIAASVVPVDPNPFAVR